MSDLQSPPAASDSATPNNASNDGSNLNGSHTEPVGVTDHAPSGENNDSSSSSIDTAALQSKPKLGPFAIVRTIGEGSFGKVKLAIHCETGQKVALKFISRKSLKRPDMSSRVDREIAYLKLLRHPHIIRLYDVITTPIDIIMVIEYASRELFDYIVQNGRMEEDSARRFFQQIITAVEYCHRHKIVHRDLKPENLLLDENLNVKIADFGLSNLMTDGDFLKTSCGSPNYAAPEVVGGKLYAGPEVDVWSCGVILYVMLVGRLPFDDDFIPNLFKKISNGVYTLPSWLPSGPKNLLKSMLVVDSMQRITMQEILQDPWFTQNLPEYLQPSNFADENTHDSDPALLAMISKVMGISIEDVSSALLETEMNVIKEAYQVMLENQALAQRDGVDIDAAFKSPPGIRSADIPDEIQVSNVSPIIMPTSISDNPNVRGLGGLHSINTSMHGTQPSQSNIAFADASPNSPYVSGSLDVSLAAGGKHSDQAERVSNIRILKSSLPFEHLKVMASHAQGEYLSNEIDDEAESITAFDRLTISQESNSQGKNTANQTDSSSHSSGFKNDTGSQSTNAPNATPSVKKQRPSRWHFGIRSRSPPFEVLSEIYKALQQLGAEFREKPKESTDYLDTNEKSALNKPKFDPYFIRCRICKFNQDENNNKLDHGCRIYIDIQLYSIDSECYLVDFKCSGYELFGDATTSNKDTNSVQRISRARTMYSRARPKAAAAAVASTTANTLEPSMNQDSRLSSRSSDNLPNLSTSNSNSDVTTYLPIPNTSTQGRDKKVNSPFPFLEVAAMVIQNLI